MARLSPSEARALEFTQFLNHEDSEYQDEVELVFLALVYCGFDQSGAWTNCEVLLAQLLGYLRDEHKRKSPPLGQMILLRDLLLGGAENENDIWKWFDSNYP